jgi:dihydropyrimidinase
MSNRANLLIQNGTVVTASDTFQADVAIAGDKIVAVGQNLGLWIPQDGAKTLDASGLLVIPGGIDPHVHLNYPQGPNRVVSSDDWFTGTVAAACGGTTTLIDFVEARPGETWMAAFDGRLAEADSEAVIDYGFHMSFNRADEGSLAEVPAVIQAGMPSFKIYMAYDGIRLTDAEMLLALETLKEHGGLPIVHAENHHVIMHLVARHLAAGHTEPRWFPHTRPAAGEAEATQRALSLAEIVDLPMHIVHVSAARGLESIRRFRERGRPVTGEVCTQHMLLTDALYDRPGFEAAQYAMAPPLRSAADTEAMWAGLEDGSLDFVVTDHCPFTLAQKRGERRTPEFRRLPQGSIARSAEPSRQSLQVPESPWSAKYPRSARRVKGDGLPPFNQIPGGAPGVETRVPLVYHFGVNQGRLSLNQFVYLTSTAAAKLYGLYPQKGTIAPGADADLTLFDPNCEVTITATALHQNCDYTPYEGMQVKGWPRTVLSRGEMIVRDGRFVGAEGRGRYLRRRLAQE